ncbi:MAG: hypothetical protein IPJ71_11285 [Bdellovibrionales bacterium]|nr:hypothetical protein [Bdellovibrionales bacterium]
MVQGAQIGAMLQAELLPGIGSFGGGWTKGKNGQSRRIEKTQRQGNTARQYGTSSFSLSSELTSPSFGVVFQDIYLVSSIGLSNLLG